MERDLKIGKRQTHAVGIPCVTHAPDFAVHLEPRPEPESATTPRVSLRAKVGA